MARLRRVLLAVVVVASLAGLSATRAHAAPAPPPCPSPQANHLASAHFDLTFNGDPAASDYITATQAGDVLAAAEQAYAAFAAIGFPAPAVNGSGKTGISVINLSTFKLSGLNCLGDIDFDSLNVGKSDMAFNLGFDVFAEIELALGGTDPWLAEGEAAWASWKALGFPSDSVTDIGPFEMSLDCWD